MIKESLFAIEEREAKLNRPTLIESIQPLGLI